MHKIIKVCQKSFENEGKTAAIIIALNLLSAMSCTLNSDTIAAAAAVDVNTKIR